MIESHVVPYFFFIIFIFIYARKFRRLVTMLPNITELWTYTFLLVLNRIPKARDNLKGENCDGWRIRRCTNKIWFLIVSYAEWRRAGGKGGTNNPQCTEYARKYQNVRFRIKCFNNRKEKVKMALNRNRRRRRERELVIRSIFNRRHNIIFQWQSWSALERKTINSIICVNCIQMNY